MMARGLKGGQRPYRGQTSSMEAVAFTTGKTDLAAVLGPLEAVVLSGLWELTVPPTSIKRLRRVLADMGHDMATSTIQTTLNRLAEKGWVQRTGGGANATGTRGQTYAAVMDESAFRCYIVTALLDSLPDFAVSCRHDDLNTMLHAALGAVRRIAQLAETEVQIEVEDADSELADFGVAA